MGFGGSDARRSLLELHRTGDGARRAAAAEADRRGVGEFLPSLVEPRGGVHCETQRTEILAAQGHERVD